EYIDYVCSYGPLIFGHAPDFLLKAIKEALGRGTTYGFTTPSEVELAEMVIDAYPACEMIRMVNSGTEATMSAIRVARGYTGRDKIIKFEGCYHGHSDSLLVKSGSGLLTQGVPTSPGLVKELVEKTLVCPYNDVEALAKLIEANKGEIACIILEPVAGNMGVLAPKDNYLQRVRELATANGIILIFDEVITGFRLDYHSAAGVYGVEPDMVCFGKIIGGGLPVGAYGGKLDIMKMVSPIGPVYQGGTLSGNPLAMSAGIANLRKLRDEPQVYETLEAAATYLNKDITDICRQYSVPAVTSQKKGMFCLFFTEGPVNSFEDVMKCDTDMYTRFFEGMMAEGILLAPSQFEAWFPSVAHDKEVLDKTLNATEKVLKSIK
ncbi:MAG: glutamate-1-semialdehyde 2,1-aminomutase, partial [Bacillota bacterium]|nr:glutamate-1-semialdehyde 2,1-aminomutase [Bacillota bacterium]